MNRRSVVRQLAATCAVVQAKTALGSQANSALTVGILGTGNRGRFVGTLMVRHTRARVTALCDLFADQIDRAKTEIPGAANARVYRDQGALLADRDIDAVIIATPVYLHPEHFEAAVAARKHIYCEKPAAADVAGVRRILRAAERVAGSRHIVFGFQNRFSPEYRAAERLVRSGQLGDLLLMECHFNKGGQAAAAFQSRYPPEEQPIRHWGAWRKTSGDIIVEQDCHGLDVLNWFAGARPLKAIGAGGRKRRQFGDNLDHLGVVYEYPGELRGVLMATQITPVWYRDVREQFFGTLGFLETNREYYRWQHSADNTEKVQSKREITIDAVEDFVNHVLAGRHENTAASACESTLTSILGRMAIDARRELTWEEMMHA